MAKSCAIIPKVKDNRGQIMDSKLFKDLLSFTSNNREQTISIYLTTKSPQFIKEWNPKLILDENNEPTLKSLISKTDIKEVITSNMVLDKLNKDIGNYKQVIKGNKKAKEKVYLESNDTNREELEKKAISFNENSEFNDDYIAHVTKTKDEDTDNILLNIQVSKKTPALIKEAKEMSSNRALNDRLRQILEEKGVRVGVLTELEERRGINGVTDFNLAKDAAEGLIELIRLAKGEKGEKALPEEFAHFALAAMGSHPLVNRLITLLDSNHLVEQIIGEDYETYHTLYNGDKVKLAKEAAGKLLAKHIEREYDKSVQEPQGTFKALLNRVYSFIKNFFLKFSINDIQKAMISADKEFGKVAKDILGNSLSSSMYLRNITETGLFYNTQERVKRDKALLQKIIDNELKRYAIYEERITNTSFNQKQRLLIEQLENELLTNNEIQGIYTFAEDALNQLQALSKRLVAISNGDRTLNEKAKVLRDVRNYIYSYKRIISTIREALLEEEKEEDNRYGEGTRILLDSITILLKDLQSQYNSLTKPLFVEFIKPYYENRGENPFDSKNPNRPTNKTVEELLEEADKDISFFERWLDSAADSTDDLLKIIDQAVKKSKEKARLETIKDIKELQSIGIQMEQAGIHNTDWLYEKDAQGKKTGFYISELNWGMYKRAKQEMNKNLETKYGTNPNEADLIKKQKEEKEWYKNNKELVNGELVPKMSIYRNQDFANMSEAQREFYNKFMDIKKRLDSYLPENYTSLYNAVKIRKDLLERVINSEDVKSGTSQVWESVKDAFLRRTDDTDISDKATIIDFEDREVQSLPIYYTKMKEGESPDDLSTDIVSTLSAYAAMANDYKEMNEIIHILEVGRDIARERDIVQTQGGKSLSESYKSLDRKINHKLVKKGDKNHIVGRINDYFSMQVYGRYMDDEGTILKTKIDKAKAANAINKITSLNSLALNILSGISNIATGDVMMKIEVAAKEFFSASDVFTADKIYGKELPTVLSELGKRVKTGKLSLWNELMNTMQEFEVESKNLNFDRKTWFSRMFETSSLFFLNNAGEHWMQTRTSLALANRYKMKSPEGKVVSLWEAMEVVYRDVNNKQLGASLQIKEGYTKEDGTKFTQDDIIALSRKIAAINQRMHGVYNKLDRSAVQKLALGRMAMMFRKWIRPAINRRFGEATYNYDLQAWTEGYYMTTWRFFKNIVKELRETQFSLASSWNNLSTQEKANIRRALMEVGNFLAVTLLLVLIDWPKDKEKTWFTSTAEYQLRRLKTEVGVLIPGIPMFREGQKIIQSPAAGIKTAEGLLDLAEFLNPFNYESFAGEEALLKSGRYKGESKAYRLFFESPLFPMNKTIYKGLHPEDGIPFYKQ